ncbi:MAG: hypothetical protein LC808_43590 [Actinobacteria bacterium]|nr:hypothetical protein [Actinomycetota bacterium]
MSTARLPKGEQHRLAGVVLVCTDCQHTWEPELLDLADQAEAMSTGCRLCGGWTWIGQITESSADALSPATTRSATR